jgi:hypothetical protein
VSTGNLQSGGTQSCGCLKRERAKDTKVDLTFKTFGRLWALNPIGKDKQDRTLWSCLCLCGKKTIVNASSLRSGNTSSCGCLQIERIREAKITHGYRIKGSHSSTYVSWYGMIQRCTNSNHIQWKNYGGRGIKVCNLWRKFENFLADMGERPEGLTLDRIDNEGNYEPNNCKWSTYKQQANNRRPRSVYRYV